MRRAAVVLLAVLVLAAWLAPGREPVLAQSPGILDIRSVSRVNGGQCDHYLVTVCDGGTGGACTGGTIRTVRTDETEVDALFAPGVRAERAEQFILMTLAYRRRAGLALTGPIQ